MHLADYIIDTTHPQNPQYQQDRAAWSKQILKFSQTTRFQKLEIIEFLNGELQAYVTFRANLTQGGKDASFIEKSRFLKVDGRWLYVDGTFQ